MQIWVEYILAAPLVIMQEWSVLSVSSVPPCGWSHLPANIRGRLNIQMWCIIMGWQRWMMNAGTAWCRFIDKLSHDCPVIVTARVCYLLPLLSRRLLLGLAFLGLQQHCFQFLNWDSRRHKEISWLWKKRGWLKMHAGAFCHYRAISGCRLTRQFHIMEMN